MDVNSLIAQLSEWLGVVAVAMLAGISPRFQRRPLVFVYPRRELAVSFSLFALILAFSFISVRNGWFQSGLLVHLLAISALSLIPFALSLLVRKQPLRSAGWGRQTWRVSLYLGFALAILSIFLRGKIFAILRGVSGPETIALVFWLLISLAEESIFRGFLQLRLVSAWGAWRGIAVSGLLFALWQLPLKLALNLPPSSLLVSLGLVLIQGWVLGFLMHKSGHVLAPALYRAVSEWVILLS